MPTPHNNAEKGQIAKTVLMPGDPLRAKYIAETYLTDPVCFNTVRNMFGYTGKYKGTDVTVMGSGMGIPSIGIYSYELYTEYDVDTIIRIGSAGALKTDVHVKDLVFGQGACTDSNYALQFHFPGTWAPIADFDLLRHAVEIAEEKGLNVKVGNIVSTDSFYNVDNTVNGTWAKYGALAVEMEAAGLYLNAARCGKKALAICTISDHIITGEALSAAERQTGFADMMEVALELARY